jgi:hypothetical protein
VEVLGWLATTSSAKCGMQVKVLAFGAGTPTTVTGYVTQER